jgi:hypothetical protein
MDVELTAGGMEDLELMLIPYSEISGIVLGRDHLPVEGINVTLMMSDDINGTWLVGWFITEADGEFSFSVMRGTYEIEIAGTDLYEHYVVHDIVVNGWNDWYNSLYLTNRTYANVSGTVLGTGGPYADGVPGVTVALLDNTTIVASTITQSDGSFLMEAVTHGTYILAAEPPAILKYHYEVRSGYRTNQTNEFVVSGALVRVDPVLEYDVYTSPEFVTVDYHSPTGTDVYLDDIITIAFSHMMNQTMFEDAFSISPEVSNLTFVWNERSDVVTIDHDDLMPNATYFITLGIGTVSWEGYPLESNEPFTWNFTTGILTDPWAIISANVTLLEMELAVEVEAPTGLTIYIAIFEVGYFHLIEVTEGIYAATVAENNFEYETTYSYFFTDDLTAMDKAPAFSGSFVTPPEPEPEWLITDAEVKLLSGGDWKVRVDGNPGLDIYIVIDGVGSFKLREEPPGEYAINVNYTEFEKGMSYDYHFSDTEGGEDKAPDWSGTGTDQRSDTTKGAGTPWALIISLLVIIVLLLIGIIVVALVLANRKKEEEMDWGDEE